MLKPKIVEGIYQNGGVKIEVKELPDIKEGEKVIVIFDMTKEEIRKKLALNISDALGVPDINRPDTEYKPFSIKKSKFFSSAPEHMGKISADELDKIIADEAEGKE